MSALHSALLLLLFSDPANALRLLPPCASPCASPCAAPRHAVRSAVVAKAPAFAAKPEAAQALVEKPAGEEAKAPAPSPSPLPPSYPSYSAANWFDTPDTEPKAPDPGPEEVVEAAEVEAAEAAEPPASKKAAAKAKGRAAKPPAKPKNAASKPASRAVRPAAAPAPAAAAADALPAAIRVGSQLPPDLTVEIAVRSKGRQTIPPTTTLGALLGSGTSVLVGMPGAFTPTCNDKHLPGLMKAAGRFARLGVSNVAVVTTNDRFVNAGWAEAVAAAAGVDSPNITMVSDPDGALVGALGLSGDMGSGLGARSQRFALVSEESTVDPGLDRLSKTSAEALGSYLDPAQAASAAAALAAAVLGASAAEVAKEAFSREAAPKEAPEAAPEAAKPQTKAEARGEAAGAGKEEPRAAAAQSEAVADFMKTLKASLKE
ncbi:hypothetical protein EMIHUDRAFT_243373 [Emiliania huxleyi CCMP1516]|uniref:Redoxin domain-containing protein n=2 Tax=Emiliania huxleyi TaxID=2903 RepID=A0A0D3J689_EMIH1|nr:hypothetical protein EMIHUDRAFT_243373 [Emiliania huxleyi CCMP1516]EOD19024.1 hypothetical protein EMIHUDRAFT_243373 [Emiliania huxleyi CCMP1516]|eukprot:XP_005771453.1 hypothetical protein EMIHUDRAFT_243373 [Emiliania huxleyi CCMP1516]